MGTHHASWPWRARDSSRSEKLGGDQIDAMRARIERQSSRTSAGHQRLKDLVATAGSFADDRHRAVSLRAHGDLSTRVERDRVDPFADRQRGDHRSQPHIENDHLPVVTPDE